MDICASCNSYRKEFCGDNAQTVLDLQLCHCFRIGPWIQYFQYPGRRRKRCIQQSTLDTLAQSSVCAAIEESAQETHMQSPWQDGHLCAPTQQPPTIQRHEGKMVVNDDHGRMLRRCLQGRLRSD